MEDEKEVETEKVEFVPLDGGYGWTVVFAIILINSTLLPLMQCFGIIFHAEFSAMGITAAEESFLLHLHSSMYCVVGFFSSPLLKLYDFRLVAFIGASLWCFGIFLTSFANSYGVLIFTVPILIGLGQGILLPATYLATYSYFKKRLTLAVSISTTGASLLAIAMPKICDILLAHTERRYTVLILFAISLLSLVGCFLMKQPGKIYDGCKKRQDHELKESPVSKDTDELEETGHKLIPSTIYNETTTPTKTNTICQRVCSTFNLELLEQRTYVLIVVGLGISFAAELNVILTMQFILPELSKFTRTQVANVSSILSIFDIIGRMLIPLLSYHFEVPRRLVYIIALILATSARTMLASFGESHVVVYVACSLIGLTKGTRAVFQSVIIPEVVPLENIPAANGINMLFNGAVSLVVGPIIGAIHDAAHSYVPALHTASVLSLTCVVLWTLEFLCSKRKIQEVT